MRHLQLPNLGSSTAAARLAAAVVALVLGACAEAGMHLPRLRVRGWVTVSSAAGQSASVGGEVGLVMPLDPGLAGTLDAATPDEPLDEAADEVARFQITGQPARCRVAVACRWEDTARARALARAEGDGP